jgi:threonylcarbamoyladenosine tRNA methylthiotransferase MtaB
MTRPRIITLGCRLNSYESAVMADHAEAAGLSDAVIVNTCAVTAEAVRSARQAIRRAAKEHPGAPVIVTGCASQIETESFAAMPEVTRVIDNHAKLKPETWVPADLLGGTEKVRVNDIMAVRETAGHLIEGMEGRARAYVQVQNGCDHRCTFCVIPYGRGNARSVPAGEVVEQVKRLVDTGHHEVVLTGVDLTSWGTDLPGTPPLGNLVQRILKLVPDLPQLRLSSIDAIEIDDALFEAVTGEHRVAPYMHLSLQHGADLILKRMKRRHLRGEAVALAERLKSARPEIALGADLIAGFPTETEAHFDQSLSLVGEAQLSFLHVFPYSPRPMTPAARMPQLDKALIKDRAARLRAKGEAALANHLDAHVGTVAEALVETGDAARLPNFTPVRIEADTFSPSGRPARLRLVRHDGKQLIGVPA